MKKFLLTILAVLIVIILDCAVIADVIRPFAVAFLFSLAVTTIPKIVPVSALVLIELWRCPQQLNLLSVVYACGIFLLTAFLLRWLKGKKQWYFPVLLVGFLASQVFNVYLALAQRIVIPQTLIAVLVGSIFLLACFECVRAIAQKKFNFPWTINQIVSLMCLLIILALGLCGWENPYFDIYKFCSLLTILLGVFYVNPKSTVVMAAALGLGKAFATTNLVYVAIMVLLAIICMAFKSKQRVFSLVALLFADLVIGIYFNGYGTYTWWSLLPLLAAEILFLCIPRAIGNYFSFGADGLGGFLVSKNTINRNTAGISLRMRSLAAVFNEMQNTYRNLTRAALPPQETATLLCNEIVGSVCAECPHRGICRKTTTSSQEVETGITTLAKVGLKHNTVTLLDVPNTLAVKCTRINTLMSALNKFLVANRNKEQIIMGLDSGKILMANLLAGISQLCSKFASDVCRSVVFDNERGELVKEELLFRNIFAEDCLITKTTKNEYVVSVLIPRSDAKNKRIEKVVSQVCGHKMIVDEVVDADTKGYAIVSVRSAPKYCVLFGMAGITKGVNQTSGDNFSFLRVTNEKTLMALCDGMGAGERAARASTLALSLVENFYKAGFPDEIIMYSVNQLLTFTGQDVFSALDMCVFDLATGDVDFIKVGAADGFIKRAREVEVVEAGSLPLGILDDIEPKITKALLAAGDMVVLVSDGVLDVFGGERVALAGFINNLDVTTPQQLADQIIAEVTHRVDGYPADDCTVTVAQLVKM
ncbi:MAG: SpoIIE family protein phosphatase [Clostridia bacterium]|nr:SpoIIE family protein phosphatase [Clostridia bacterium]